MKCKNLISILLAAVSMFSGCSNKERITWQELNNDKKPSRLIDINERISHVRLDDELFFENWKSAKKTIEDGYGDCEDIAFLGAYLAEKYFQYPPLLLILAGNPNNSGHAVALLKKEEKGGIKYGAIENSFIIFPEKDSIDKIVNTINQNPERRYKFTKYAVIPLNSVKADWRTGDSNLYGRFWPSLKNCVWIPLRENK